MNPSKRAEHKAVVFILSHKLSSGQLFRLVAAIACFLILVSISAENAYCSQSNKKAAQIPSITQRQRLKQGWLPITYKQNRVVAVGPYVLASPLRIPKRMLLTSTAFVSHPNGKRKKVMVDFFFSPKYESEIQKWAENLPKNYPVALPDRKSLSIQKVQKYKEVHTWTASSVSGSKYGGYSFLWEGTPGCAAINKSMNAEHSAGSAAAKFPEWCGAGSPAAKASRIIYLNMVIPWVAYK